MRDTHTVLGVARAASRGIPEPRAAPGSLRRPWPPRPPAAPRGRRRCCCCCCWASRCWAPGRAPSPPPGAPSPRRAARASTATRSSSCSAPCRTCARRPTAWTRGQTPSCCRLNAGPCAPAGPRGADHPGPALLPANKHPPAFPCPASLLRPLLCRPWELPAWPSGAWLSACCTAPCVPHPGALPGLPCPEAGHGDTGPAPGGSSAMGGWGWGLWGG